MDFAKAAAALVALSLAVSTSAHAGATTGPIDNFDCVNDTGETAEGFEIDIEDISSADLNREFPSNFTGQEYVNRFGVPTVTDGTAPDGHKQVSIVWAATWTGTQWAAKFGSYVYLGVPSGNGVLYLAKPAATQGDSCWLLGQGANYPKSGCEHFGLSFNPGVTLGHQSYHWLVPDPANPGHLTQSPWQSTGGPIPPAPSIVYVPPAAVGQPPVIHAVAEADPPEPAQPQWGKARWVRTYTAFVASPAALDALQKNLIPLNNGKGIKVTTQWNLLQTAPAGEPGEKLEVRDDTAPALVGKVPPAAIIHRYEYYVYTGLADPDTNEVICGTDKQGTTDCVTPLSYYKIDPVTGKKTLVKEQGKFQGAHMEAINFQ